MPKKKIWSKETQGCFTSFKSSVQPNFRLSSLNHEIPFLHVRERVLNAGYHQQNA